MKLSKKRRQKDNRASTPAPLPTPDYTDQGLTLLNTIQFTPNDGYDWDVLAVFRHRDSSLWHVRAYGVEGEQHLAWNDRELIDGIHWLDWDHLRDDLTVELEEKTTTPEAVVDFLNTTASRIKTAAAA